MIATKDERKLLKVADDVSELLVAARSRGGNRGSMLKMVAHACGLVDRYGSRGRA